ncbi:MAG: RHS repeat domain-containing protein [Mucilaginibacter sp.]
MVSAYVNNDPSATLIGGGSLATFTAYQMLSAYRYDQLNRIAASRVYKHLGSTTNVWAATADVAYGENFMYDMNGNLTQVKRSGTSTTGFPDMDNLTYNYPSTSNKLDFVGDGISSTAYTDDIDNQTTGNYTYDNNGNLIGDVVEEIQNIGWSVYGKMKTLTRISTSTRPELTFKYDASGNRVSKRVHIPGNPSSADVIYYYLRDAQGNVMAVYQQHQLRSSQRLDLQEQHVYGSSRLGLLNNLINMNFATLPGAATSRVMGTKSYELTNHLGNVMSVFTDRKIPFETSPGSGVIGHYASDIINHQDYYAFGANKPGRTYAVSSAYRYSFNDKEQDGESVSTSGNTQDYGMRIYNPSLGKWLSVDPLVDKYPWQSPYISMDNNPIYKNDLSGMSATPPDDYVFNEKGDYVRTDKNNKPDQLVIENSQTKAKEYYEFNDPAVDVKAINNAISNPAVGINKVEILSDNKVDEQINNSGVKDVKGTYFYKLSFAKKEGAGKMDYGMRGFNSGDLKPNTFYIRGKTAYNIGDIGNYMWGLGMANLEIPYNSAVMGAHGNNIFNGRRQGTAVYDFGPGTYGSPGLLDSPGDQRAIKAGYFSDPVLNNNRETKAREEYKYQAELLKSGEFPNGDD